MSLASLFAGLDDVRNAVIGDNTGQVLESYGDADGETTAALMVLASKALGEVGNKLGLGVFDKLLLKGGDASRLLQAREDTVLTVELVPGRPTGPIEKRLEQTEWMKADDMMVFVLPNDLEEEGGDTAPPPPVVEAAAASEPSEAEEPVGRPDDPWAAGQPLAGRLRALQELLAREPESGAALLDLAYGKLRRALARGQLPEAGVLGELIGELLRKQSGLPGEVLEERLHRDTMQTVLDGVGAVLSGDNRGGVTMLCGIAEAVHTNVSLRWAAALWATRAATGIADLKASSRTGKLALVLADGLDVEAKAIAKSSYAEVAALGLKLDIALRHLEESRTLFRSIGNGDGEAACWLIEARALAAAGRVGESIRAARLARDINPARTGPRIFLARQAMKDLTAEQVEQLQQTLLAFVPRPKEIACDIEVLEEVKRGVLPLEGLKVYLELREAVPTPQVVHDCEDLVTQYPNFCHARETLAWKLLKLGEYEAATQHFKTLLEQELSPTLRSEVLLGLGCLASKGTQRPQAPPARLKAAVGSAPPAPPQEGPTEPIEPIGKGASGEYYPKSGQLSSTETGITGGLRLFALPDLLEFLRCCRRTGTLVLSSAAEIGAIYLREGKITGAASPRCPSVTDLLERAEQLTPAQLEEALERQRLEQAENPGEVHRLLGAYLVECGVAREAVQQALMQQVFEALRELLGWTSGEFAFEPETGEKSGPSEIEVELDSQFVLLELMKEQDEDDAARS